MYGQEFSALPPPSHRKIYTITELTRGIKRLVEDAFPFVWLTGEISNFRMPVSGHYYFGLKDDGAQISAVIFRGQNRNLGFVPEDGMLITGLGRISIYEPRGSYQVILEYLEPRGVGAIQIAFEQLKSKLSSEGLFDDRWKRPLPYLPRKVGIITSPTGAVIHDITTVLSGRFPNLYIIIYPVTVQGSGADEEIEQAIRRMNEDRQIDVAILARGGGSLEDLASFNSETVARAVFASEIPIISAVGHETDFTIADFVADFRAPTPSAAAEAVVPMKRDLLHKCEEMASGLSVAFHHLADRSRLQYHALAKRLIDPKRRVYDLRLRCSDLTERLQRLFHSGLRDRREHLDWRRGRLVSHSPAAHIKGSRDRLFRSRREMGVLIGASVNGNKSTLRELSARLKSSSPEAVLSRGYSITRTVPTLAVVRDPDRVSVRQELEVMVEQGTLRVRVLGKEKVAGGSVAAARSSMLNRTDTRE